MWEDATGLINNPVVGERGQLLLPLSALDHFAAALHFSSRSDYSPQRALFGVVNISLVFDTEASGVEGAPFRS